jgi:hypothetical protein
MAVTTFTRRALTPAQLEAAAQAEAASGNPLPHSDEGPLLGLALNLCRLVGSKKIIYQACNVTVNRFNHWVDHR